ncbi:hypothetical protein EGW08_022997, partial [Elysia chlorotica]
MEDVIGTHQQFGGRPEVFGSSQEDRYIHCTKDGDTGIDTRVSESSGSQHGLSDKNKEIEATAVQKSNNGEEKNSGAVNGEDSMKEKNNVDEHTGVRSGEVHEETGESFMAPVMDNDAETEVTVQDQTQNKREETFEKGNVETSIVDYATMNNGLSKDCVHTGSDMISESGSVGLQQKYEAGVKTLLGSVSSLPQRHSELDFCSVTQINEKKASVGARDNKTESVVVGHTESLGECSLMERGDHETQSSSMEEGENEPASSFFEGGDNEPESYPILEDKEEPRTIEAERVEREEQSLDNGCKADTSDGDQVGATDSGAGDATDGGCVNVTDAGGVIVSDRGGRD